MKPFKILTLIALVAVFSSCSKDDDNNDREVILTESEIPSAVMTYKTTHFPDHGIIRAIQDTEWSTITYELDLEGNFELDFNADHQITDIDGASKLPDSVIPQPLLDYVSQHYADQFITDWELEANYQQIELSNGMELEFDMDGTFRRIDND